MPADLLITGAPSSSTAPARQAYVADVAVDGRTGSSRHPSRGRSRARAGRSTRTGGCSSPGFIDMHAHSDLQILANPDHTAKVSQGVTLEVLGQDGLSFAPIDDADPAALRRPDRRLERRARRLRLRLGHASRATSTGSTRASRATRRTWSRRARCG